LSVLEIEVPEGPEDRLGTLFPRFRSVKYV
jgi:hypothetical protein